MGEKMDRSYIYLGNSADYMLSGEELLMRSHGEESMDTMLLENLVALQLFRLYGHDMDNERVFFYNDGLEVDFYVPDDEIAIQVSYSLRDEDTRKREIEALQKLPNRLSCGRRLILTYDEEETIPDKHGIIEVIPVWKWLLEQIENK